MVNTIKSMGNTICPQYNYKIFLGYDGDDIYYSNQENAEYIKETAINYNIQVEFIELQIERGYLTKMWNELAKRAYNEKYTYMYMCGDDILYNKTGWVSESIEALKKTNNIGVSGPTEIVNPRILTQCFVHNKHYEIFGYFFPEEIKNWYCDDWINAVYIPSRLSEEYTCHNTGGGERYGIVHCLDIIGTLIERDKEKIKNYIEKESNQPPFPEIQTETETQT